MMNEEKQIAQAIVEAQKMYHENHATFDIEKCFQLACNNHNLSFNLWYVLSLA